MPVSKAQQKAVAKYTAANYDRIEVKVQKGEKAVYTEYAKSKGESLNGFINRAMKESIERDRIEVEKLHLAAIASIEAESRKI